MTDLTIGYSPCPNDTYIFHALIHGLVSAGTLRFTPWLADVERLNGRALAAELPISKVSCHLMGHIREKYRFLDAGAALGRGCGPLLVARAPVPMESLTDARIALPGRYTTAALLLRLYHPGISKLVYLPFDQIMPSILSGDVDAGVIIHESRFTYRNQGLTSLVDLGAWWEMTTGHPIPLGGIAVRRDLGEDTARTITVAIRDSILYAREHPEASRPYIRSHAQEMSDEVCSAHIGLYVNDFSLDLKQEGRSALLKLFAMAEDAGVMPRWTGSVFLP